MDSGTLACRVAGILLLLYAQPLTKIASLKYSAVVSIDGETRIMLGVEPIPVPLPFAAMLNTLLTARRNLRTAGGSGPANPWLFPGVSAGHHLTAQRIMRRLRMLGINLRGARNTALQTMVSEVPPPLVAELLGYTYNSTQRHADIAAQSWAQYSSARPKPKAATSAAGDVVVIRVGPSTSSQVGPRPWAP